MKKSLAGRCKYVALVLTPLVVVLTIAVITVVNPIWLVYILLTGLTIAIVTALILMGLGLADDFCGVTKDSGIISTRPRGSRKM